MKPKAGAPLERMRVPPPEVPDARLRSNPQKALTPLCCMCMQKIDLLDEAVMLLSGQWMPNKDLNEPVFVLEVDAPLKFVQMPNGQYALVSEDTKATMAIIQHAHDQCVEQMKSEAQGYSSDWEENE